MFLLNKPTDIISTQHNTQTKIIKINKITRHTVCLEVKNGAMKLFLNYLSVYQFNLILYFRIFLRHILLRKASLFIFVFHFFKALFNPTLNTELYAKQKISSIKTLQMLFKFLIALKHYKCN